MLKKNKSLIPPFMVNAQDEIPTHDKYMADRVSKMRTTLRQNLNNGVQSTQMKSKCINSSLAMRNPPGVPRGSEDSTFCANRGRSSIFLGLYFSSEVRNEKMIHSKVVGNFMLFLMKTLLI